MNPNYLNRSIDVKRERGERRGSIDNKSSRGVYHQLDTRYEYSRDVGLTLDVLYDR